MKILLVSRSWPSNERSGVTLAAAEHVRLLAEAGHEVTIIGADAALLTEDLPVVRRLHVPAKGSGSLYAPARVDRHLLAEVLRQSGPDVILVEAWQTALTEVAVDAASELGLPVVMLSHGISIHPYTWRPADLLRTLGWLGYRWFVFPGRLKRLAALAVLDQTSTNPRFFDRILAERMGVHVLGYTNTPIHWRRGCPEPGSRKRQILVIGYFSPVKNQLGALKVLAGLPSDVNLCFIGKRAGAYYEKCVKLTRKLDLTKRVKFLEDDECDLAAEIAESLLVFSPSRTEVLPLTLLEAMASGTPYVATPVGAVPSLAGGLLASNVVAQRKAIVELMVRQEQWKACARAGIAAYETRHTREHVAHALNSIVKRVCSPDAAGLN